MDTFDARTRLIYGDEGMEKLARARVAVFGLGGVGGHAAEALARSGIGALDLCDSDRVTESNRNRQILALRSTLGMLKTEAAAARIRDINPACVLRLYPIFYSPETAGQFDFREYDYVVDAVDTVSAKIGLVMQAKEAGTPIICSMGAGNKLDPSAFEAADLYDTAVDPLARVMRVELKKRGVKRLRVVYSKELPVTPREAVSEDPTGKRKRMTPGSNAFVPAAAGLLLAAEVVAGITGMRARMGV